MTRVVCARLMGGLGNQMFQYAFARSISLKTGATVLLDTTVLETESPGVTPRCFALEPFAIAGRVATRDEAQRLQLGDGILQRVRRFLDRFLPVAAKRIIVDQANGFDESALGARPPVYLSGYWQSERYFAADAEVLREDFRLRDPLSPNASRILAEIAAEPSISVHVRRGDYLLNSTNLDFHGVQSRDYYVQAVERIQQEAGKLSVFIFSDDLDWCRANLPFDERTVFVEIDGAARDHEEMHLMSQCDHHVVSNSSFGWWGAWLGKNPDRIVVAPAKWFAAPDVKSDIVPASWLRI